MATLRKLLLLSAFVASTVAVPVQQNAGQCARYCTDASDFTLRPGSTYTYDYETTTVTTVQGGQEKTQIQITAQADIEVLSKCELSLRVSKVSKFVALQPGTI
ncbi:hypothetical protein AVEN_98503-1 [Araneus ventricosus]|uniref:Vitellogenin domain-containing protein n=1 Tax=Araneus ventricosus TaxID=182803 RepID=A0A4Y2EQ88_ARAVE|nr:hypothetical protein AVEN_98503-1 [Araneus ventricosus]